MRTAHTNPQAEATGDRILEKLDRARDAVESALVATDFVNESDDPADIWRATDEARGGAEDAQAHLGDLSILLRWQARDARMVGDLLSLMTTRDDRSLDHEVRLEALARLRSLEQMLLPEQKKAGDPAEEVPA